MHERGKAPFRDEMRESSNVPKKADDNKSMNHVNLHPNCVTILSGSLPILPYII